MPVAYFVAANGVPLVKLLMTPSVSHMFCTCMTIAQIARLNKGKMTLLPLLTSLPCKISVLTACLTRCKIVFVKQGFWVSTTKATSALDVFQLFYEELVTVQPTTRIRRLR
jgi:hypothetical protein